MEAESALENFEGLDAYHRLVRKELINTVKTNRIALDDIVSFACCSTCLCVNDCVCRHRQRS
jgi:hypothetical protein